MKKQIRSLPKQSGGLRAAAAAMLASASMLLAPTTPAHAQEVIRLVVPFAAGSYTDNVARLVAPGLSEHLGKNVIIENRAGANGIIGADYVSRAKPDGLTLLVGGASVNTVNPSVYKELPYDPVTGLLPVARIGQLPFVMLVNPSLPIKSMADLVQYAKANPGKLSYGTPNATTLVASEAFKRSAGVDIVSIPYKSSPQAMTDLIGNQIQVLIADFATALPQVQTGKARVLAVTMKDRSPLMADTPTISETVPGFDVSAWTGLLAPGKTPPAIAQNIYKALQATLADPELQARFKTIGFDVKPMGPDEFGPYIRAEIEKWRTSAKQAGIEPQ